MNSIVFWHGWGMRSGAWNSLGHHLKDCCEVHLPSLPGYDDTPAPLPYTAEAIVDAMLAKHTTPITLCGWSLGAMLAILAAHRHPEKIRRLILISATPSFVQRDIWLDAIAPLMLAEFSNGIHVNAETTLKRFIALFNHNDAQARNNVRELGDFKLPPLSVLEGGLGLLRDLDLREMSSAIRQPTLLIHGAHDPLMPLAAAKWLTSSMPNAKLAICKHAAHAPFISDPAHCAKLIMEWLDAQ
jgi:pimeloyl-[acyl-carrier protein] methyl ester esterase